MALLRDARSYLFVPLSDRRYLAARSYARAAAVADAIILDLEDSLPETQKASGRKLLPEAIQRFAAINPRLLVRINGDTWEEDTAAAAQPGLAAILVPKAERFEQAEQVRQKLTSAGSRAAVLPLLETPRAVLDSRSLLREWAPECAFFGCEDLAASLGVLDPTPFNMGYSAQQLLLVCAELGGIPLIGSVGPFSGFQGKERAVYKEMLQRSRELGFSGSFAVHPAQLTALRSVFSFEEERARPEAVLAAAGGSAVFALAGRMYGPPMLKRYRNLFGKHGK